MHFKKRNGEHLADHILTEEVAEYPKLGLLFVQKGIHAASGSVRTQVELGFQYHISSFCFGSGEILQCKV